MKTNSEADIETVTHPVIYEPAADTAIVFKSLLAEKGLGYYIVSTWVGWRRHGVIRVVPLDARGEPDWTKPPVQREEFPRSSSAWGQSDKVVGRVRTGSPKHAALLNLIQRMKTG